MACKKIGRLDGKVALVTGGSRGIGKAISLRLAQEGADVVINYQNTKEHAESVSRLIDKMGMADELDKIAAKINKMHNKELAKEFAGKGVTVNAIAPGFIETDMVKGVPDEVLDKILSKIPLGRLGKASEVAGTVAFLASQEGDFITGQVIDINGGLYI